MRTTWLTILALAFTTVMPAQTAAAQSPQSPDERVGLLAASAVRAYPNFTIFDDVTIDVNQGTVTLQGRVTSAGKKDDIGRRVSKIDGVRTLVNDIGVLPASPVDADLRERVARAIYKHPSFWRYAQMTQPPIHIVVEHARITLTGRVASETERMLACSLAQVTGSLGVTDKLKIDKPE